MQATGSELNSAAQPETVKVRLADRSYDIVVGSGLLAQSGERIAQALCGAERGDGRSVVIVVNPSLARTYAAEVLRALQRAGFAADAVTIAQGETRKTLATVNRIYANLCAKASDRRTAIVALGGGVVGDVAGFAAATYQRGLDFVQIPTTLLAQVDSSVGGKVGVNLGSAKNLIGAFHQPRLVVADTDTLRSLPMRERRSGLAEVLKYGAIADAWFFEAVERETAGLLTLESPFLAEAIARSCSIKARTVEADERDLGVRAILNFGHTVGHALEAVTGYRKYRHGEAIAIGMVSAGLVGEQIGFTDPSATVALERALGNAGFETRLDDSIDIEQIVALLSLDKKAISGKSRFVLISKIGEATAGHAVPDDAVRAALSRQRRPR